MYLFFVPEITSRVLSESESLHCIRVLRYKKGDIILLTDGNGHLCEAKIDNADAHTCTYTITRDIPLPQRRKYSVHLAFAPPKNSERIDWLVEKCTELGVDSFTPLLCRFSERPSIRPDRLQNIIISAAKQSLNPHFPILHPLTDFKKFVDNCNIAKKYIAHCDESHRKDLVEEMGNIRSHSEDRLILIGPEGDFSEDEIRYATERGFTPVCLGNYRFRCETAAVIAIHTLTLYG